jgi:hypothetical protein
MIGGGGMCGCVCVYIYIYIFIYLLTFFLIAFCVCYLYFALCTRSAIAVSKIVYQLGYLILQCCVDICCTDRTETEAGDAKHTGST